MNILFAVFVALFSTIMLSTTFIDVGLVVAIFMIYTSISFYGYLTAVISDVEGNLDFLKRSVLRNWILKWNDNDNTIDFSFYGWITGAHFVFLGDSVDKGTGDITIVKALVLFKKKYPNRVNLIIGNRDSNKIRMYFELLKRIIPEDQPYWVEKKTRVDLNKYLKKIGKTKDTCTDFEILKWILEFTMGAKGQEENRRKELAEIKKVSVEEITDEKVVQSYINHISPTEENIKNNKCYLFDYLKLGVIVCRIGNTVYTHGAITKESIGHVPGDDKRYIDADEWFNKLNAWKNTQIHMYLCGKIPNELLDYGLPTHGKSITYANWFDGDNPVEIDQSVVLWALSNGITKIVTGHRPHGSSPLLIQAGNKLFWVVSLDTSYSDKNRIAVFSCNISDDYIDVKGINEKSEEYSVIVDHITPTKIGKFIKEFIIKILLPNGNWLGSRYEGYTEVREEFKPSELKN